MAVPSNRALERTAVNKLRLLLERHGHIVQEVAGGSDMGEDLIVSFVRGNQRTNEHVAVQVKGGRSYRASVGYAVAVRQHAKDWVSSNVPVLCVVFDPDMQSLYWANATEQIATAQGRQLKTIRVAESAVLNDATIDDFVAQVTSFTRAWSLTASNASAPRKSSKPIGSEPIGGSPDAVFSPIARWIEDHQGTLKWITFGLFGALIVALLALMTPGLYLFALEFSPGGPAWLWPVMVLGYTLVGLGAILREARRGNKPVILRIAVYLPLFLAYYAAISVQFNLNMPDLALALVGSVVPQVVKYTMLFGTVYYVGREIDRRRRMRSIGYNPDTVGDEDPREE